MKKKLLKYKIKEETTFNSDTLKEEKRYHIYSVKKSIFGEETNYITYKDNLKSAINVVKVLKSKQYEDKERWIDENDMMIEDL